MASPHRDCVARRTAVAYFAIGRREGRWVVSIDDGGATWRLASSTAASGDAAGYFGKVAVDPKNADLVYVSNTGVYRSRTAAAASASRSRDRLAATLSPALDLSDDCNRMILAAIRSRDQRGRLTTARPGARGSTSRPRRSTRRPWTTPFVLGDRRTQDSGAVRVPVAGRSPHHHADWEPLCAGGEAGYTAPDPLNPTSCTAGRWRGATSDRPD